MAEQTPLMLISPSGFTWNVDIDADGRLSFVSRSAALGTAELTIENGTGNVGLGVAAPQEKLVVAGKAVLGADISAPGFEPLTLAGAGAGVSFQDRGGTGERFVIYNSAGALRVWEGSDKLVVSESTGNVGIGSPSPSEKLVVNGKAVFGGTASAAGPEPVTVTGSGAGVGFHDRGNRTDRFVIYNNAGALRFWEGGDRMVISQNSGNVGIGVTAPREKLVVVGQAVFGGNVSASGPESITVTGTGAGIGLHDRGGATDRFVIYNNAGALRFFEGSDRLVIRQNSGNVGIGTTSPSEKLHVDGNIRVTGDIVLDNADCAEDFEIVACESVEPGMVMIFDSPSRLSVSERAYDKRVAGILAGAGRFKPGIILGRAHEPADAHMPLALTGRVCCFVDADHGAIEVGDLLTSSPTRGHAMKAVDPQRAFGAVIGKALEPLTHGRGLIPVLVCLL